MQPVYTVDQIAGHFGKSARTIRKWITLGRLQAKRVGKGYLITEDALAALVRPEAPPVESRKAIAREFIEFIQSLDIPKGTMERIMNEDVATRNGYPAPETKTRSRNMQKITPFLWYDGKAEEAARFYTSIFKNSKVLEVNHFGAEDGPVGVVTCVTFELEGQQFMALDGGPEYTFTPAISFFTNCETQEEVDYLWEKLSDGGEEVQCGWLRDKYGVSWQIIPSLLWELMRDQDAVRARKAMDAMLQMVKIDTDALRRAVEEQ